MHSCPTLVSIPLIPNLPIIHLLPLPLHHLPLAPGCPSAPPASSPTLTPSGFFNGMLEVFEQGALNYSTLFCPILSTSSASRNPFLNHLPLFRFSALCSDRTHSRSDILSRDTTHASGGVVIFVRQGLSFSKLSISSFSLLYPYSDYVGVNISLNNSSSLSFLNVYAPPQWMAEPISFPPREIYSFWGLQLPSPPLGLKSYFRPPGEEVFNWVISSDLLPLNDPDTPTLLHRSSSDISFAPSSLAPGRCFRTWVLTTYQFFCLSLSLRPFAPTSVLLPSTFRKLAETTLSPTLTPTVLLQRNTHLFFFSPLWH